MEKPKFNKYLTYFAVAVVAIIAIGIGCVGFFSRSKKLIVSEDSSRSAFIQADKGKYSYKINKTADGAKITASKASIKDIADTSIISAQDAEFSINEANKMLEKGTDRTYTWFKASSGSINGNPAWLFVWQRGSSSPAYLYEKISDDMYALTVINSANEDEIFDVAGNLYFYKTDKPAKEFKMSEWAETPESSAPAAISYTDDDVETINGMPASGLPEESDSTPSGNNSH